MSPVAFLDAGPLGLVTNPRRSPQLVVPEIADYEVRRELLRANKPKGIARLDALARLAEYLPITTAAMQQAAIFWAQARQQGQPTAGDKAIDGDVILAAQAATFGTPVVVATTNVGHLSRFVPADLWTAIGSDSA